MLVIVLLIAVSIAIFGDIGNADAQETPGIPVWLYFVAQPGDNCWDLAKEYRDEGRFCEEMLLVNQHIKFADDGVPIIEVGTVYWLHPRWTQTQGHHVLYESNEHMIVTQPDPPPAISLVESVQEQGGGDGAGTAQIIITAVATTIIIILMGVVATMVRDRRAVWDQLLSWFRQLRLRRSST